MALVLIHRNLAGEPLGVWDEEGNSKYVPGNENAQKRAKSTIADKGTLIPWDDFVEKLTSYTNSVEWWDSKRNTQALEDELDQVLSDYTAYTSNDALHD